MNCDNAFRTYSDEGPFDVVLIAMKFMRSSRGRRRQFSGEPVCRKIPGQHYAFVTGAPVLRKQFMLQDMDDFMGASAGLPNSRFG